MGIANVVYTHKFHINSGCIKLLWEYQLSRQGANPGGHSVIQRLEFWKTSLQIIKKHFWFGVGTGDIAQAYEDQYNRNEFKFDPRIQASGPQPIPGNFCNIWNYWINVVFSFTDLPGNCT